MKSRHSPDPQWLQSPQRSSVTAHSSSFIVSHSESKQDPVGESVTEVSGVQHINLHRRKRIRMIEFSQSLQLTLFKTTKLVMNL